MQSILLIGVNHLGTLIAERMQDLGHEVMAVDKDEERINEIQDIVTDAQIGDAVNEGFLRSLGVNNYDICFVTVADDFESSLITTMLLKKLGARKVIARAKREIQETLLLRNGADEVIFPERLAAEWAVDRYGRG
jgi:trk system potassium uptake protein TrkA